MGRSEAQIYLSLVDEQRFGVHTARANQVTVENLPTVLHFCKHNQVDFLIARCSTTEIESVHQLESRGFQLMDTLVYFVYRLEKPIPQDDHPKALIQPYAPGEEEAIRAVAAESFGGYQGHYHADPRLPRALCDEAYLSWAYRSCVVPGVSDQVLVACADGRAIGFLTLSINTPEEGEVVLNAVAKSYQRQGVYRSLLIHALDWCKSQGAQNVFISTQLVNIAVQKVWTRLGFEPDHSYYTFHKWFDKNENI